MFFLAFFFLLLSNVFFLYHSFSPCTLASGHRKGSPSSSWRWRLRFYRRPVDVYHISQIAMTGWALYDMHRAAFISVETCFKTCLELPQNLATWFSYITIWWNQFKGSWRFDAHQWNSSAKRESSYYNHAFSLQVTLPAWARFVTFFDRQTFVPNDWWQLMCSNVL